MNKKRADKIINNVNDNIGKYLDMDKNKFPLMIFNGDVKIHKISDNLLRLDIKGQDY